MQPRQGVLVARTPPRLVVDDLPCAVGPAVNRVDPSGEHRALQVEQERALGEQRDRLSEPALQEGLAQALHAARFAHQLLGCEIGLLVELDQRRLAGRLPLDPAMDLCADPGGRTVTYHFIQGQLRSVEELTDGTTHYTAQYTYAGEQLERVYDESNQQIAAALGISDATVRTHMSNILSKLHMASRTQAALYALREGLASLDDVPEALRSTLRK